MDTVKTELINEFFNIFRPKDATFTGSKNLELFEVFYNLSGVTMNQFDMNYKKSSIRFQAQEPNIVIDLIDFVTNLDFNFNITAAPRFYEDIGSGAIHFEFDRLMVGLTIKEVEGVFQFAVEQTDAIVKGTGTHFNGTGDLSFILNQAATLIQGQLVNNPNETIGTFVGLVLPAVNGMISKSGCSADLGSFLMNWCAMKEPKFSDEDVILVFKGEATPNEETSFDYPEKRLIPYIFDSTSKDISLYISDYTLNTTLWSVYTNHLLTIDIRSLDNTTTPIPASTLKIIFPTITDHIPADTPLSIGVKATNDYTPNLSIENGETIAIMMAEITFSTIGEGGALTPFLQVESNVTIAANFYIDSPFTFTTDISQMRFRADKLNLDIYDLTNIADLNSIIGTISGFARNYINREFSGMKFKEFDLGVITINVQQTVLYEKNRYIFGDMAPHFIHKKEQPTFQSQNVKRIESKPVTYDDQVKAMAALLKFTPLYASIQEFKKNEDLYKNIGNIGGFGMGIGNDFEQDAPMPKEREEDKELIEG